MLLPLLLLSSVLTLQNVSYVTSSPSQVSGDADGLPSLYQSLPSGLTAIVQRVNFVSSFLDAIRNNMNVFFNNLSQATRGLRQNQTQSQGQNQTNPVSSVGHGTVGAGEGDLPHPSASGKPTGIEPPRFESTVRPALG